MKCVVYIKIKETEDISIDGVCIAKVNKKHLRGLGVVTIPAFAVRKLYNLVQFVAAWLLYVIASNRK